MRSVFHAKGILVTAVLAGICFLGTRARAADPVDWKIKALALNYVTGDSAVQGEINSLTDQKERENTKQLLAAAVELAKQKDQPFNYNAAFILSIVAIERKEYETAETFLRVCKDQALKVISLKKMEFSVFALQGISDLYFQDKKYEASARLSQELLETLEKLETMIRGGIKEDVKQGVLRRLVRAMAKQGKYQEASRLIDNLAKVRAGDWRNLELKGWLQQEAGHTEEAVKIYNDLIKKIENDKDLKKDEKTELLAEVHYVLSNLYTDLEEVDKAVAELKLLLSTSPNEPTYNNNLGYIWAEHGQNLEEAEKLIRKALEDERKLQAKGKKAKTGPVKDNAAYLDSLGWVLFKQKKFKEAKPYLEQAVEDKEGQHIEIYDHLGDVHLALGEKAEAIAAWKKGLEAPASSRKEKERRAQLEKKLKELEVSRKN